MARKRKSQQQSEVANKATIVYKGNVTIHKMIGKTTYKKINVHNTGTLEFFRILLLSICGEDTRTSMPRYIHTFDSVDSSTCVANIPFTARNIIYSSQSNTYSVKFEFLIPFSQLFGSTKTSKIKLYNSPIFNSSDLSLAEFELPVGDELEADGVTNYAIYWTMTLANPQ